MDYLEDICSIIVSPGPDNAGDTGTEAGEADDESVTPGPASLCHTHTSEPESTSRRHGDSPRKVELNQTSEQMFV